MYGVVPSKELWSIVFAEPHIFLATGYYVVEVKQKGRRRWVGREVCSQVLRILR